MNLLSHHLTQASPDQLTLTLWPERILNFYANIRRHCSLCFWEYLAMTAVPAYPATLPTAHVQQYGCGNVD